MANPIPALFRSPELKDKILFTLLMMLVYRLGSHITVPGVNVPALQALSADFSNTFLGVYDLFVGGNFSRATIFALGIMPYISASIMFQLLSAVFPTVQKLQREGEQGRKKLTQWTRYTTVLLCAVQAFGYASFLQTMGAVNSPGMGFVVTTVIVLTVGGVFVMWMGEQITERGVGNGMSLMILFSIIQSFPATLAGVVESVRAEQMNMFGLIIMTAMMVAITAGVVAMTMASRRIPIQIPRKVVGRGRIREGQKSHIPLRINSAGVMPIIFALSFMAVPGTLAAFSSFEVVQDLANIFQPQTVLYYCTYAALIIFFTYFYTAIIFNPVDLAENLKKQGAFIPGVKPGARTAQYIDRILTRVTLPGSVYLAIIALIPSFMLSYTGNQSLMFGGTSLLIVVGVGLDTVQQAQQHLLLRHYDGFMKKGRVKMRGRQRYM